MLKYIKEEVKYVEITGYKNVRVEKPDLLLKVARNGKQSDVSIQFFNADLVATWEHLYFAVLNALMVFRTNRNLSRTIAVEVILYASAQRQIQKAFELIGVKPGCANVAVTVVGNTAEAVEAAATLISKHFYSEPEERVLELSAAKMEKIRSAFMIDDDEMLVVTKKENIECALVDLVIERMALLATRL